MLRLVGLVIRLLSRESCESERGGGHSRSIHAEMFNTLPHKCKISLHTYSLIYTSIVINISYPVFGKMNQQRQ